MKDEHKQFLTENCNRLKYGKCSTLGCLRRGGYTKGAPDYNQATCIPFEIFQELHKPLGGEEAKQHEKANSEMAKR